MMNSQALYNVNAACILVICGILGGAFYFQFGLHEQPCPLCLLQRMAMLGLISALVFNMYFGIRNEHIALVIVSAMVGVTFSIRQVLLHICPVPGEPTGYGTAVLGMHLYSWGVLVFGASTLGAAGFLVLAQNEAPDTRRLPSQFEKFAFYAGSFMCLANVVATCFECGLGPCCENGPCT
jgi:disulfide bond formation protein DsbB